jgi:hypothetical protein
MMHLLFIIYVEVVEFILFAANPNNIISYMSQPIIDFWDSVFTDGNYMLIVYLACILILIALITEK